MTRILAIEGTDIRLEIDKCGQCLIYSDEHLVCPLRPDDVEYSHLMDDDPPPSYCPLPEKGISCDECKERTLLVPGNIPMCRKYGAVIFSSSPNALIFPGQEYVFRMQCKPEEFRPL